MTELLRDCPFCGGVAEGHTIGDEEPSNRGGDVICCPDCGASSHVEFGRKENIAAMWNQRALPSALMLLVTERERQVEVEGYRPKHDDAHGDGELALAAALYAIPYDYPGLTQDDTIGLHMALELTGDWTLKPEPDRKKALVKAGALIIAELERLERAGV